MTLNCEKGALMIKSKQLFHFLIASTLASLPFASAFAGEPFTDESYNTVYKWDFSGVNPHCIVFDFESGTLDLPGLSTRRLVNPYSAQIVDEIAAANSPKVRQGRNAARFELRTGDRVSGGWRAELRDLNNAVPGSEVWYSLSTLIPKDFPDEPENSFVLIQWHDQKVPWNNPEGHSPPLATRYRNHRLDITLRHAFEGQQPGENGRERILYSHPNLERGVWHDLIYHVRWSARPTGPDTGFVRAWLDNKQIVDYTGPVGYFDDLGPYVKFGIYARHDVKQPHVVYHDAYRRGNDYDAVCVDCSLRLDGSEGPRMAPD